MNGLAKFTMVKSFPDLPLWLHDKEHTCQYRRGGFDPWVRKTLLKRKWQPTPIFLPGKSHDRGAWQTTVLQVAK